jgi:large subunit ribosomal protein L25
MADMQQIAIQATKRQVSGKQVKILRTAGKLPAVLYGHKVENQQLEIDEKEFTKVFKQAGESTLVNLVVDGKPQSVLIQEVQYHYLTSQPIHVDFYAVDMTEKLKVHVPIRFLGEAPAVKSLGGILSKNLSEVEVECLPSNIPQAFEIDLSVLNTFEDLIRVSDIKAPNGVSILDKLEEVVVSVAPPRTEEELKSLSEEVKEDVTAVEGVVKPEAPVEGTVAGEKVEKKAEKAEKK